MRARQTSSICEGVTVIVQPLYVLVIGGWSADRRGALEQAASTIVRTAMAVGYGFIWCPHFGARAERARHHRGDASIALSIARRRIWALEFA